MDVLGWVEAGVEALVFIELRVTLAEEEDGEEEEGGEGGRATGVGMEGRG